VRSVTAIVGLIIGGTLALAPTTAAAQRQPRLPLCIIRAQSIDFGTYEPLDGGETIALGRVQVLCQANASPALKVELSAGDSGNFYDRTMLSGAGELHYNLFIDPAHDVVAGDGSQGTSPLRVLVTNGLHNLTTFPYFAAIPPRQPVAAGEYSDSIQVEVTF
jgi:spore coat protein U-like protein